jgi:GMP synthase-like glutamine amidotransferase
MPTLLFDHGTRPGSTGLLGETLREYGHRMRVVRLASGDALPPDLDDVDAIVVGDGGQTLLSGAPAWAEGEMALLREAHGRQIPICGLGFGARLLAKALGGEIVSGEDAGWRDLKLNFPGREDPLYKGIPWTLPQVIRQSESIAKLPDGGTPYGSTAVAGTKPVTRSFAVGVFTFGFEHKWWLDQSLAQTEGSGDIASGWSTHGAQSMRFGRRLAESIALYLMPVDRVHAGRVKDLHY